jgi:hypothetical protein
MALSANFFLAVVANVHSGRHCEERSDVAIP